MLAFAFVCKMGTNVFCSGIQGEHLSSHSKWIQVTSMVVFRKSVCINVLI